MRFQRVPAPVRFYGSLLRDALADFHSISDRITFWGLLIVGLVGALAPSLVKALSPQVSPLWGVALMVLVVVYRLARRNYERVENLETKLTDATRSTAHGAAKLSSSVVTIETVILPMSDARDAFIGRVLALRFHNVSEASLSLRCRLINLECRLPDGNWLPEDWFRERWLHWVEGDATGLVPGATRDCEVVRQDYGFAQVVGLGGELPRGLSSGVWRSTIDVEGGEFAVRHLEFRFEWRAVKPPYSPGESFHWLGKDFDSGDDYPSADKPRDLR